jgi:hypothetical protein
MLQMQRYNHITEAQYSGIYTTLHFHTMQKKTRNWAEYVSCYIKIGYLFIVVLSNAEQEASLFAEQQRCFPLYCEQSGNKRMLSVLTSSRNLAKIVRLTL